MAHFAKLGKGNKILTVVVVSNDVATTEQDGVDFLNNLYKTRDVWKQTSYNTYGGVHQLGGTPFRKNYAQIGGTYDSSRDAFIDSKPFQSWVLNETTCQWEAPVSKPNDESETRFYEWEEATKEWKQYNWNETTQQWELDE